MIAKLSIKRFKSIRELSFTCRKVNVFIGPPDTGKTNILEALTLLARMGWGRPLDQSLRLRPELGFDPLFYRQFFDAPVEIVLKLRDHTPSNLPSDLRIEASIRGADRNLDVEIPQLGRRDRIVFAGAAQVPQLEWLRQYAFVSSEHWRYSSGFHRGTEVIFPPNGENLLYIARHNSEVFSFLKETVSELDWKLRFDQAQKTFRLSEVREDEILDYNLDLLSDTLKRFFFYGAVLLTSRDATLVLDEPDVFAFPPQPKTLGEMIGTDASNQFFLTTHSPYFLAGLIGKTPAADLALYVCYRDDRGDTTVKALSQEEISKVVDQGASVFFNLDAFLPA